MLDMATRQKYHQLTPSKKKPKTYCWKVELGINGKNFSFITLAIYYFKF